MDKKRKDIVVHLIKRYTYPGSMLDPMYPKEDAQNKAKADAFAEINEIVNHQFRDIPENFFEAETDEESSFILRESFRQQYKDKRGTMRDKILFKKTIEAVATYITEKKYGVLDKTKNPQIFITEEKNPTLIPEVEQLYMQSYDELYTLLKNNRL